MKRFTLNKRFIFTLLLATLVATLLNACGDDNNIGGDGSNGTGVEGTSGDTTVEDNGGNSVTISSVTLISDKSQIPSDASSNAQLTALVKDDANNFVAGITVQFATNNDAGITVTQAVTNENGQATATLSTLGNKRNRVVTASATVGSITDSLLVAVTGTEIIIQGPEAVGLGSTGQYSFALRDSAGNGISNETVQLSSAVGNSLSASSGSTDINGKLNINYTANNSGSDTLTAQALGAASEQTITISQDAFSISSANAEVALNSSTNLTVSWQQNGSPVNGQPVNFSTTRGNLTSNSQTTNASGEASVSISANNAGPAVITATTDNGLTASVEIEFIATQANSVNVQADPAVIGPNDNANIIATVRDPDNNLVKGKQITFTLNDVTGGSLSSGTATTNSLGRAVTSYQASGVSSGTDGVRITATVQDTPAVNDEVSLTVANRQVFVSFGTDNTIIKNPDPANPEYKKPFLLQVIDINGRPIRDTSVELSVIPPLPEDGPAYRKGYWQVVRTVDANGNPSGNQWSQFITTSCFNEDLNRNGIFDNSTSSQPDNDENNNGELEPGNHALVVPASVTTDDNGQANFSINYPAEFGAWLRVEVRADLRVEGTEHYHRDRFWLTVAAEDLSDPNTPIPPPGRISPFGESFSCPDTL